MKELLKWVVLIILMFIFCVVLGTYMYQQEEKERHEQMCKVIDARLISSGMVDCNDGK